MNGQHKISAKKIHITGLVQGVGFRPYIYRLANHHGIKGWVENSNDGVYIHAEADENELASFIREIRLKAPEASNIFEVRETDVSAENFKDFVIVKSENRSDAVTEVSPDIAVCQDCLADLKSQKHRIAYPFINCTNCGPRFSIIQDLPYDRVKTTMKPFLMCDICREEYENVLDRRFHAQPVACNTCGPEYELVIGEERIGEFSEVLKRAASLISSGKVIAVKGIGGFQIACDATNENAVNELRRRKHREGKPFAVMFRDEEALNDFTVLFPQEVKSLTSWRRPIVIVQTKKDAQGKRLAKGVSVGFHTVGAMLPYMPFHYQLFENLHTDAIVLTSGNISDEPIVIENKVAEKELISLVDAVLTYNRDIHNRTDDSVAFVVNEKERMIRRSRGYAPQPVNLKLDTEGIVAGGAELVNCFCIGKGNQAILSQHIGDLKNLETLGFYEEAFERFVKLFRVKPELAAHDLHPDYLSTRFIKDLRIPMTGVQHHHAHIASAMAEHGLDEKVIGVSMDGTGLGDDGHIWGGEFFTCDLVGYDRFSHFEYIPLPGGDSVTKEPWRTGLSYLYHVFGSNIWDLDIPIIQSLNRPVTEFILQAIDKKINTPLSSSAGRVFDAVAAILGVCSRSKFHAEAPMRLESIASGAIETAYPFDFGQVISFKDTIREIVEDIKEGVDVSEISAKFHNTMVNVVLAVVSLARKETGLNKVVLSGGVFQNRYLLGRIEKILEKHNFEVFMQNSVPANDGGIALGQLAVAAKRRELGLLDG